MKLWFDKPAEGWTEAILVGNGRLGGMIQGGTKRECIPINEDTLWTGQPHDYANPGAHIVLDDLRRLLNEGKQEEAHDLGNERFMSKPLGQQAYQPLGRILLEFTGHEEATGYERSLDLGTAIASVGYRVGGTTFRREVFVSHPDQALIIHLTAEGGNLKFSVGMDSLQPDHTVIVEEGELVLRGRVGDYQHDRERGKTPYPKSALRFEARLKIILSDGTLHEEADTIRVTQCTKATLHLVAATNFVNYHDVSADPFKRCRNDSARLASKSYVELKNVHIADYDHLFSRVSLDLGSSEKSLRPTNLRVSTFKEDKDPYLVALIFQYGRYLLISSSRPETQPANLQGIWNNQVLPPWDCKYTTNINVEMNYWPSEVTGLPELTEPLIRMVQDLSETGEKVAQEHYNLPGWVTHHNTDLWRAAAPINHSNHGIWVTGGAWLCQHLWWHYQFNGDEAFLKNCAYPILKEACRFFIGYLVSASDGSGRLISGPSNSPECGGLVMGPTMDHQIVRTLFRNTIEAASVLGIDHEFAQLLEDKRKQIAPNQVGQFGQLQEWLEDIDDPNSTHRHVSHLWGLFPGNEIHPLTTPELAEACRVTLRQRGNAGDGGRMGWSAAWKMNFMARLLDGELAYAVFEELVSPSIQDSIESGNRERLYVNIFAANPPFQIEENFGATSAIAEMLLQSHLRAPDGSYYQDILPALPGALGKGLISGLKGRGGFEFEITWSESKLSFIRVASLTGAQLNLRYRGKVLNRKTTVGQTFLFTAEDFQP